MITESEAVARAAALYFNATHELPKPEGEEFDSLDDVIESLCPCYAVTTNDEGEYFLPEAADVARWHRLAGGAVRLAETWPPPVAAPSKGSCPCGRGLTGRQAKYCGKTCRWKYSPSNGAGRPVVPLSESEVKEICDLYTAGISLSNIRGLVKRGGPVVTEALRIGGVAVRAASGARRDCIECGRPIRRGHKETALRFTSRKTCQNQACAT